MSNNRKFTVVSRSKSYTTSRKKSIDNKDRSDRRNVPQDNDKNYEEHYNEDKQKITNELKIIDKFIARMCRSFADSMVVTERLGRKYCILFKYNDDPDRGEIYNDRIEGLDTKYILSGRWIPLAKQYYSPQKCRSVKQRIIEYIREKKYNNGIDPITERPYRVSVFHYKGSKSVFDNGIIVSRDGIDYN